MPDITICLSNVAVQSLSHNVLIDNNECFSCGILCAIATARGSIPSVGILPLTVDPMCLPSGIRIRMFSLSVVSDNFTSLAM